MFSADEWTYFSKNVSYILGHFCTEGSPGNMDKCLSVHLHVDLYLL